MSHLIVLPGNSPKNKAWGELMVTTYAPGFDSAYVLEYDHWKTGDSNINFTEEEAKLAAYRATLSVETEVILFAKSAGSLLAFLAIAHNVISPTKCVFFGIPFNLAADSLFKHNWNIVDSFAVPAIAFHNEFDPTAGYNFTRDILSAHAPTIVLVTLPESDHKYHTTELYTDRINIFVRS